MQYAGPETEKSRVIRTVVAAFAAEGVEWILATDHRYDPGLFPGLPGTVVPRRAFPGKTGWKFWYDRTIPRLARRQGADLLMLTGGVAAADCGIPQCLWMPERADPADKSVARSHPGIYGSRLKGSLDRADRLLCYSQRDREKLAESKPELRDKINILPAFPAEAIRPMSPEEKDAVRSEWLAGKEYFFADLTGGNEHGVVDLLKAFSFFKKRQHSRMRLVLGGRMSGPLDGLMERIRSYKYRDDVDWSGQLGADGRALMGAAYAVLLPFEGNGLGVTLLNTWRAGVPAIVVDGGLFEEMAAGASPGMVSGDPASLAAQLMRIYKDEDLRAALIGKGFERLKNYGLEQMLRIIREIAGSYRPKGTY